ncbi:MAG: TonB-dependent receptor [Myxococcales bacterium]|nr:TonB-dependent receptor [Myxococcales bacterium]
MRWLVLALVVLTWTGRAFAAPRTAGGSVVTEANDPMPDAEVILLDPSGKVVAKTRTDEEGRWRVKIDAKTTLVVRVSVPGLPPATTLLRPDQDDVRTTMQAAATSDVSIAVEGEKKAPPPAEAGATSNYGVEGSLLTKMPGTRGDPFAAATSLPSVGRPPALATVYAVRGAAPEDTATFLDGAPLPHAFHFGGLVAIVPAPMLSRVSLLPGGFGTPYGRATAGIVDAWLAAPPRDRVHASLQLDAIDVGATLSFPLRFGAGANNDTTLAVGFRRSHVDTWIGSLVGDRVAGDLPRYLDAQLVAQHDFGPKAFVRGAVLFADDLLAVTDESQPADRPRSGKFHSALLRAHVRGERTSDAGTLVGVVSFLRSEDTVEGEIDLWSSVRRSAFVRLETTRKLGDGERPALLTFGLDTLATQVDGVRVLTLPTAAFGGSATFLVRGKIQVRRVEPSAYLQLALSPFPRVQILPGVRFDHFGEAIVSPRVSMRIADGDVTFKGSVGAYARPPSYESVDARDQDGTLVPMPFVGRAPRGLQAAVGIERRFGKAVSLSVDVYTRAMSHVLVAQQQAAVPMWDDAPRLGGGRILLGYRYPLYTDDARSRAMGIEALLRFSGESFSGFVGYALSRAEIRDSPEAAFRRAPFDQTHVLNAAFVAKLGRGFEAGARFRLAVGVLDSPYPATDIAPKADPNIDPSRPLPELQPLHSLDLRLEKGFRIGEHGAFAVYVEVRNVYDRRVREPLAYNYVYGYPVVSSGLPIIPNLGLRGSL